MNPNNGFFKKQDQTAFGFVKEVSQKTVWSDNDKKMNNIGSPT